MEEHARDPEFLGVHARSLDTKHRLVLPALYRTFLKDGLVLTIGFDDCVRALTNDGWAQLKATWAPLSEFDEQQRQYLRAVTSYAVRQQPDGQGRIAIPGNLRALAGMKAAGEVAVVGRGDFFELWDAGTWAVWDAANVRAATHGSKPFGVPS